MAGEIQGCNPFHSPAGGCRADHRDERIRLARPKAHCFGVEWAGWPGVHREDEMRASRLLGLVCVLFLAAPARAQNIWPVSFAYWWDCPDPYLPDLRAADHSVEHARALAGLDDHALRDVMQTRNQWMSQRELSLYNSPNMLPPIYPPTAAPGTSSEHATSPENPAPAVPPSTAAPTRTGSPFPMAPSSPAAGSSPARTTPGPPPGPGAGARPTPLPSPVPSPTPASQPAPALPVATPAAARS